MRDDCLFCWYWWNYWPSVFIHFFRWEMIICFVDIGGIIDHQCLYTFFRWEMIICFVDIGGIIDHQCSYTFFRWEMIICFVDIGGIIDHQCLYTFVRWEMIICFVDIGGIIDHQCSYTFFSLFYYFRQNSNIFVHVSSKNLDFQHHMSRSLLLNGLRWEMVVPFVDILCWIVDHHCKLSVNLVQSPHAKLCWYSLLNCWPSL